MTFGLSGLENRGVAQVDIVSPNCFDTRKPLLIQRR
jgi:hypothetical protein